MEPSPGSDAIPDFGASASLLERLIAGDDAALGAIYDSYAPLVYGLAKSVSGDELTAREVTSEVFCFLWEFPDRVDLSRGSLKAYLGMIAHRRAVDAVRRSERRRRAEDRFRAIAEQQSPSGEAEALRHSTLHWRKERLAGLVNALPTEQRDALRLAYFEGRTYRQVAAELGIPEGTAKSRLRIALARLREQLESDDRWAWT